MRILRERKGCENMGGVLTKTAFRRCESGPRVQANVTYLCYFRHFRDRKR